MSTPLAYEFGGQVFCADCALRCSRGGSAIARILLGDPTPVPDTMEELILELATAQALAGAEDNYPVPYALEHNCDNCGKHIPAIMEVA